MATRKIRIDGDSILRKICKPVTEMTPRLSQLIDDMFDTMYEANGVGLAAPQVGIVKRIVVIDYRDVRRADRRRGVSEPSGKGWTGDKTDACCL